jgi:hypothetical protein
VSFFVRVESSGAFSDSQRRSPSNAPESVAGKTFIRPKPLRKTYAAVHGPTPGRASSLARAASSFIPINLSRVIPPLLHARAHRSRFPVEARSTAVFPRPLLLDSPLSSLRHAGSSPDRAPLHDRPPRACRHANKNPSVCRSIPPAHNISRSPPQDQNREPEVEWQHRGNLESQTHEAFSMKFRLPSIRRQSNGSYAHQRPPGILMKIANSIYIFISAIQIS